MNISHFLLEKFFQPRIILDAFLNLKINNFATGLIGLQEWGSLLLILLHPDTDNLLGIVGSLDNLANLVAAVAGGWGE